MALKDKRIVDPVLTNLAIGYSNAELIGEVLMPYVNIDKEGGKVPKFGRDHFRVYNTERALRASSNRVNPSDPTGVDVVLTEHDLEYPVDYREQAEAMWDAKAHAAFSVTEGIQLRREKKIADLAQNPSNYPTGSKAAVSGSDSIEDPSSDPETMVSDYKAAVRARIVREPNTMVLGYTMARWMRRHPKLKAIISTNRTRLLTLADLAQIFEVPRVVVGTAIYDTDAGVQTDIWGATMVMAYVPNAPSAATQGGMLPTPGAGRSVYEPSYGYTLRRKGMPMVDTYTEGGGKIEIVRATDIFEPALLGAEAGFLLTDAGA